MTTIPDYATTAPPETPASWALRVLALAGGLLLFLIAVPLTLAAAFAAPVGMVVLALLARRHGRTLTRGASWVAAVVAATLAFALAFGVGFWTLPAGSFARVQQAADSAAAAQAEAPPPAWMERIAPGAARASANSPGMSVVQSRGFTVWASIVGMVFVSAIFGVYAGSVGWASTSLLLYGARGAWLPRAGPRADR